MDAGSWALGLARLEAMVGAACLAGVAVALRMAVTGVLGWGLGLGLGLHLHSLGLVA